MTLIKYYLWEMRNFLGNLLCRPNTRIHMKLIQLVIFLHFIMASLPMSYKNRERDYWQTLDLDIEK